MLFEYGALVKVPLEKEKYVWILLQQIIEPLIVFEKNYRHYPCLSRDYIL